MKLDDDDFTLFGLPQRFALDTVALAEQWRALQARVHPDRFAAQGDASQRLAMQWAVRINEAYQRLKDPLKRAAYLCELRGAPIDAERNTAMPASFLGQQMAWREALDEAADAAAIDALEDELRRHESEMFDALARSLDHDGDAAAAAGQVRALMFVARFRHDLERRLEAIEPTR
jgi:molecular chaperone HscB